MSVLEDGAARQNGAPIAAGDPSPKGKSSLGQVVLTAGPLALAPCDRHQVRGFDSGQ
jgi:hypothetical protein